MDGKPTWWGGLEDLEQFPVVDLPQSRGGGRHLLGHARPIPFGYRTQASPHAPFVKSRATRHSALRELINMKLILIVLKGPFRQNLFPQIRPRKRKYIVIGETGRPADSLRFSRWVTFSAEKGDIRPRAFIVAARDNVVIQERRIWFRAKQNSTFRKASQWVIDRIVQRVLRLSGRSRSAPFCIPPNFLWIESSSDLTAGAGRLAEYCDSASESPPHSSL